MSGWVEVKECPWCGGQLANRKSVTTPPNLTVDFCGGSFPVKAVASYLTCKGCGLIVQSPRFTPERLNEYYSSGAYRQTNGATQDEVFANEDRRAKEVAAWLGFKPESHLDIGCSRGMFLEATGAQKQFGYDAFLGYAEGITIVDKPQMTSYELVSSLHCLEHVSDPIAELAWYKSLSTKYVLVEIPSITSPLRFAHLTYFPPDILIKMFVKAGMKVEKKEITSITRILGRV